MWAAVTKDCLRAVIDKSEAVEIFAKNVKMVEIEIFSYCNRKCWFCPNSVNSRTGENLFMDVGLYENIINQLGTINYSGMLTYSRYNEPFANDVFFERLKYANEKLPNANLHTNTNGDYLNFERLNKAYDSGLRSLNIQLYMQNQEQYNHDKARFRAQQVMKRLNLEFSLQIDNPDVWLEYVANFKDMKIRMYGRNFAVNGNNRGEQVDIHKEYIRTSPCIMPVWSIYIDYNGKTVPCCNFRSDIVEHKDYILSDLNNECDIFTNYFNENSISFRKSLLNYEIKDGLCKSCNFALEEDTEDNRTILMRALE